MANARYKQGCEYLNGAVVYWPAPLHAFDWDNMVSMSVWMIPPTPPSAAMSLWTEVWLHSNDATMDRFQEDV